jgi:hypothetical protein
MKSILVITIVGIIMISSIASGNVGARGKGKGKGGNTGNPAHETCANTIDFSLPFCNFYQVNSNYVDLGCSQCGSSRALINFDASGSGVCSANAVNTPSNCIWIKAGSPNTCDECDKNYYLSNNLQTCTKFNNPTVNNCFSYFNQSSTGTNIVCDYCNTGYTLLEDNTCVKNCSSKVANCDNCFAEAGNFYCSQCKKGFVGVVNSNASIGGYTACLSFTGLLNKIVTPAAVSH